ncbi:hypothetical protein DFH07DRAFT_764827 [Mycena maculata]|uniref:Uncharacterized protein n=1 Tax=Mycena maculata TaxID=230809 RepID=A0AAD7NZH6_9AGAR|nr:hypothetical protein DFH07DRAFT_764827 [Mycena maculata]
MSATSLDETSPKPTSYDFLVFSLELRGPTGLVPVAGVASRIIRHRALEYKCVDPADPMYMETRDEDSGDLVHTYTSVTTATVLSITGCQPRGRKERGRLDLKQTQAMKFRKDQEPGNKNTIPDFENPARDWQKQEQETMIQNWRGSCTNKILEDKNKTLEYENEMVKV